MIAEKKCWLWFTLPAGIGAGPGCPVRGYAVVVDVDDVDDVVDV